MSTKFYFDVWPLDDLNGAALGELTQAYGRTWQRLDQAIGSGQFTINRHDSQYTDGWCAQDNLVRVRLVEGGPFAYDDERYVSAFFIEEGDDEALSADEEGGEEITRGGRDAVVILRRAIVNFEADFVAGGSDDAQYWTKALIDGNVHFVNRNAGSVLRVVLRNATARTPDPLEPMVEDFNSAHDTAGIAWAASDEDWNIPVGQNLLEVLGTLAAGDTYWRMGADLVFHAWDDDPGADVSGSVSFTAGDNIREAAQRQVHARDAASSMLVQGTKKNGTLTYHWLTSPSTETLLGGRREGFVEYQATPTTARLDKAARRAIRSLLKQHDGPTTLGVEERPGDPIAFTDYIPGDSITVDIPGIWDSVVAKVYGVQMDEDDAGDALVTVILEEQPFDPASGNNTDAGLGDGTGGSKCGDCPPLPPHVPGECASLVQTTFAGSLGTSLPVIWAAEPAVGNTKVSILSSREPGPNAAPSDAAGGSLVPGTTWTVDDEQSSGGSITIAHRVVTTSDTDRFEWAMGGSARPESIGVEIGGAGTVGTPVKAAGVAMLTYALPSIVASGPGVIVCGLQIHNFDIPPHILTLPDGFVPIYNGYRFGLGQDWVSLGYIPVAAAGTVTPTWLGTNTFFDWSWQAIGMFVAGTCEVSGPLTGQQVTGEAPSISIGASTTTLTVDWAYAPGSLRIRVDGVLISPASYTETTPGSGVVTLSWALDSDETVTVDYQAAT